MAGTGVDEGASSKHVKIEPPVKKTHMKAKEDTRV
jgi:hypothetical protein